MIKRQYDPVGYLIILIAFSTNKRLNLVTMQHNTKTLTGLQLLISLACLLSGLLAGENIFRYAMEVPGWRHIDIAQWGEYSRHADLGKGIFILPFEAIVAFLCLFTGSIIIIKSKTEFQPAALPVYASTFFALMGLGLTFMAAPYMLRVRTIGNDAQLLQQTFNNFHQWGFYRAIAQVLSFCTCVWAMGKVYVRGARS
jgi:hypothetical protein